MDSNKPAAAAPTPEPRLVHIGDIRFDVSEVESLGETPRGTYIFAPIIGGSFTTIHPLPEGYGIHSTATEGLKATILPASGGDYAMVHGQHMFEMKVSVVAKGLNHPHLFHITSFGACQMNELVGNINSGAENARSTEFGELNSYHVFRFTTDGKDFAWLNCACVIGQERLLYNGETKHLSAAQLKLYQFLVR